MFFCCKLLFFLSYSAYFLSSNLDEATWVPVVDHRRRFDGWCEQTSRRVTVHVHWVKVCRQKDAGSQAGLKIAWMPSSQFKSVLVWCSIHNSCNLTFPTSSMKKKFLTVDLRRLPFQVPESWPHWEVVQLGSVHGQVAEVAAFTAEDPWLGHSHEMPETYQKLCDFVRPDGSKPFLCPQAGMSDLVLVDIAWVNVDSVRFSGQLPVLSGSVLDFSTQIRWISSKCQGSSLRTCKAVTYNENKQLQMNGVWLCNEIVVTVVVPCSLFLFTFLIYW